MRREVPVVGFEFFGVEFPTLSFTLLAERSSDQRSQLAAPEGRSRPLPRPTAESLTTLAARDSIIGNPQTDYLQAARPPVLPKHSRRARQSPEYRSVCQPARTGPPFS